MNKINLISIKDYTPFGMLMPGRHFDSGKYRFGFNGKEGDDEVKGEDNSLDFGARIYDSRLGLFNSTDQNFKINPGISPYSYAANCPIYLVDRNGKDPFHLAMFAVGAMTSFVSQVAVQYAVTGNMKTALEKVDYFDVIVTGCETMLMGPEGLQRSLSKTLGNLAMAEFAKATVDLNFDMSNQNTNDMEKMFCFSVKIAGTTKSGKDVVIDFASSQIFGGLNKYGKKLMEGVQETTNNEIKELKRLNNLCPDDLSPNIKVNGVVQSVNFEAAYTEGIDFITDYSKEKAKNFVDPTSTVNSSENGNISDKANIIINPKDNTTVVPNNASPKNQ